jgi:hypothetical protein
MAEYYSVEAFLSDNARCPCKFLHTVPNLGYLANQHDKHVPLRVALCDASLTRGQQLQDKTVVELPFWLGLDLARMEGREFLALGLPKAFSSRVRNALAASSKAVNLRSLSGGSFYGAGVKLDDAFVCTWRRPKAETHGQDRGRHAEENPLQDLHRPARGGLRPGPARVLRPGRERR